MYTEEEKKKAISSGTYIFNEVYRKNISEEAFSHKHFGNPFCTEIPYIIDFIDEKPSVMRWMMGMDMVCGDKKIKAVQSSDDAALPEVRGLAFIKIRKASEKIMKSENTDFVYGCFYPGNAMEIAEKFGEKNIVNLYTAKLPLNESVYRWKRFNIPICKPISRIRAKKHIKNLQKLSLYSDNNVVVSNTCPFAEEDYTTINTGTALRVTRSKEYYAWKFAKINSADISYITTRKNGNLTGFAIVKKEETEDVIIDWDVFEGSYEKKLSTLAMIISKSCNGNKCISAPSLNPENGELKLFLDLGFKDMRLQKAPVCICAKAFNKEISEIINNSENWKHRFIDADYFLN